MNTPLYNRVLKALAEMPPDNPRMLAIKIAEKFYRDDNPGSPFSEPPSFVYEAVEKEVMRIWDEEMTKLKEL